MTDRITKIETEFAKLITEELTDDEFWEYVREWYDVDNIVEDMLEWDWETKKRELKRIHEILERKKKNER